MIQQTIKSSSHVKEFITAGVPILDESGKIVRVITNALLSEESRNISAYLRKSKEKKKSINEPVKLIAASKQMREILQLVDLVKNTESTIIIEGETGVGKSMLARYIHESSNRRQKKMTEINCGAIPPPRERKDDIMPAVNYFAEKYTKKRWESAKVLLIGKSVNILLKVRNSIYP